jgi:multisubunit Na+/H+ antiporter MnhG subunit
MLLSFASTTEIVLGIVLLVIAVFLYRPLKAHAAAHGHLQSEKLFTIDELFLQSWMLVIFLGAGLIVYGAAG